MQCTVIVQLLCQRRIQSLVQSFISYIGQVIPKIPIDFMFPARENDESSDVMEYATIHGFKIYIYFMHHNTKAILLHVKIC